MRSAKSSAKMPNITSTKPLTGHSLGAAGVQESILFDPDDAEPSSWQRISRELDPEFDGVPIGACVSTMPDRHGAVNSFGFGGTNATLVFQRHSHRDFHMDGLMKGKRPDHGRCQ